MDYCKTDRDKMIAGVMAAVLATPGELRGHPMGACGWFWSEYLSFQLGSQKERGECHRG